jgi:hypothetical protein
MSGIVCDSCLESLAANDRAALRDPSARSAVDPIWVPLWRQQVAARDAQPAPAPGLAAADADALRTPFFERAFERASSATPRTVLQWMQQ